MAIQNFDEIHILKRRSIPYKEYFGDMRITPKQKKDREKLALILEDIFVVYLALIRNEMETDSLNETYIKQDMTYSLYDELADNDYFDTDQLDIYVPNLVNEVYKATVDNLIKYPLDYDYKGETPYWVSEDRAKFIAENEANTICHNKEYLEAVKSGKTHKIWMAYPDDRVRETHAIVDGAEIPIDAYFDVGAARMLFPKDLTSELSTGASFPEEYVNCRCSVKYV